MGMEVANKAHRPALDGIIPPGKDSVSLSQLRLQQPLVVNSESPSELNPFLSLLHSSSSPLLSTPGKDCS